MKTTLFAASLILCISGFSQNVGIGTINPAFKLDVRNGSINTDTGYRIGTFTVLTMPGTYNLFVGKDAGRVTDGGSNNTFCGREAGYANTTGYYNSFFGSLAGRANTTGGNNSFFGQSAGRGNGTSSNNCYFGASAGFGGGTGNNCIFGVEAGFFGAGGYNCFFGNVAGVNNASGNHNSFFGTNAGLSEAVGTYNTIVGFASDVTTGNLTNATAIGAYAEVDASDKVRIGNNSVTSIGGQVGWSTFSDDRFKHQVQQDVQGLAFINKLRPVSYLVDLTGLDNFYTAQKSEKVKSRLQLHTNPQSPSTKRHSGFIAQEVEQAAKELGFIFSGVDKPQTEKALYGLRYGDFVVPLVKAVQEQQSIIEEQNKKIEMLINEISLIKEKMR